MKINLYWTFQKIKTFLYIWNRTTLFQFHTMISNRTDFLSPERSKTITWKISTPHRYCYSYSGTNILIFIIHPFNIAVFERIGSLNFHFLVFINLLSLLFNFYFVLLLLCFFSNFYIHKEYSYNIFPHIIFPSSFFSKFSSDTYHLDAVFI